MIKSVRKATPFALALLLALIGAASAGDNAGATFSLTSETEVAGVGPGETIAIALALDGMVGVKNLDFYVEVSPADGFDLESASITLGPEFYPPNFALNTWFAMPIQIISESQVRLAGGGLGVSIDGAATVTLNIVTSATMTTATQATLSLAKISIGPKSDVRDEFGPGLASEHGLSDITVNPPVSEPTLAATSAADISLDFSAVGTGDADDGSAGEAELGVLFRTSAGVAGAGQAISWSISNDGGETIYVLAPSATSVAAGASATVSGTTDADGAAALVLDAEGDKFAASTSASVTATTTATNSEGVSRTLTADFSVTWDVPVPAELASFAGQVTADREILLTWGVASQSSNLGWEVYRSIDNVVYERVSGLISGDGTTDVYRTYEFVDTDAPVAEVVYYYLRQLDLDGSAARSEVVQVSFAPTAIDQSALPAATSLAQNFPNPFNPETTIRFDLSEAASVTLRVYDVTGQLVRTLASGQFMQAGTYSLRWDGRTETGAMVSSGVYFYELRAGSFTSMKKMTLVQ